MAEASETLGIAQATLRRWADDGRVPVYLTPGGHRRFARESLEHVLAEQNRRRPTLARLGASPERLTRAYRAPHPAADGATPAPWLTALDEQERLRFRERGRSMVGLLVEYLDAEDPEAAAAKLREASQLAAEHGRATQRAGASMSEAVEGFLRYRTPFLTSLADMARRRALSTPQATEMLVAADRAMDQLLLATMTGHTLAAGSGRASRGRRTTEPTAGA
jgi:excisionase family DNA binding protein